jgi:antitoxin component HigA of HigAB toxin-antitoxin module
VLDFSTPHVLRNAKEYRVAVAEIDRLLDEDPKRGSAAYDRLVFLSVLVEAYEDEHDPLDKYGGTARAARNETR